MPGVVTSGRPASTQIDIGSPVRDDTRFLIGSVCKAHVATVVMQFVDEGTLDLDTPVVRWLPGELDDAITVRHLLTHTSGLPDAWPTSDDADLPDAIASCARRQIEARLHARPGTRFGYSNAGYVVLGRLIEVVAAAPFEQLVNERVLMGSSATFDLAAVATGSFAVGHLRLDDGSAQVVDRVWGRMAMSPAGGRLWATAGDLLDFADLHLGVDGDRPWRSPKRCEHRRSRSPIIAMVSRWGSAWSSTTDGEPGSHCTMVARSARAPTCG